MGFVCKGLRQPHWPTFIHLHRIFHPLKRILERQLAYYYTTRYRVIDGVVEMIASFADQGTEDIYHLRGSKAANKTLPTELHKIGTKVRPTTFEFVIATEDEAHL